MASFEEDAVVRWSEDVAAADWIVDRLRRQPPDVESEVRSFLPEGFPAYARVLHPAWRAGPTVGVKVRWAELARAAGVPLTPTTRFEDLGSARAIPDLEPPLEGTLACDELDALVELLGDYTGTPRSCWFAIWEGYGWIQGPPATAELVAHRPGRPRQSGARRQAPPLAGRVRARIQVPDRPLILYAGPIEAAAAFCRPPLHQSPNLWWPYDRAWCVASEIDFRSTFLGGDEELTGRLVRDPRLEAIRIAVSAKVTD
jgi:hypothetical protein